MPFVPVLNTCLAEIRMTLDGQQVENTLWFEFSDNPTPLTMTDLADELLTWWGASVGPLVSTSVQLREVVITDMTTPTGPQVTLAPAVAEFGDNAFQALPANVSLTVSFRTALRGRSFRGRNYFVGLCENQVDVNTVAAGTITSIIAAYEELLGATFTAIAEWVVVSRFSGVNPTTGEPIPRVNGVTTPVTNVVIVDSIVDSQRRRLPGRGA